jgi:hypothetical protein
MEHGQSDSASVAEQASAVFPTIPMRPKKKPAQQAERADPSRPVSVDGVSEGLRNRRHERKGSPTIRRTHATTRTRVGTGRSGGSAFMQVIYNMPCGTARAPFQQLALLYVFLIRAERVNISAWRSSR